MIYTTRKYETSIFMRILFHYAKANGNLPHIDFNIC